MRLLLDANLSGTRIGEPLRERGDDVLALTGEAELERLEDELVLELATAEDRILVTRNSRDFAPIPRRWAAAGRDHAGLILIWSLSHRQFAEIVNAVAGWLDELPRAADWRGLVVAV